MKFLADTQILIWAGIQTKNLPKAASIVLNDAQHEIFFSVASIWEIAIKTSRGREDFDIDPAIFRAGLIAHQFLELSITGAHAQAVVNLPPFHKDPFDRMLVAQAEVENLFLLTADSVLLRYGGNIRKV